VVQIEKTRVHVINQYENENEEKYFINLIDKTKIYMVSDVRKRKFGCVVLESREEPQLPELIPRSLEKQHYYTPNE
jgi:catalase